MFATNVRQSVRHLPWLGSVPHARQAQGPQLPSDLQFARPDEKARLEVAKVCGRYREPHEPFERVLSDLTLVGLA